MTDTGGDYAQQDFTSLGHGDIDFNDLEGFLGLEGNGGARLDHADSPVNKNETISVIQRLTMNNQDKSKTLLPYRDNHDV
jgi:hypothetical protein